jgi:hypothetical protein
MLSIVVMILAGYLGSTYMDRSCYLTGVAVFLIVSGIGTIICSYIEAIIKEYIFAPETDHDSLEIDFAGSETAAVLVSNEQPTSPRLL